MIRPIAEERRKIPAWMETFWSSSAATNNNIDEKTRKIQKNLEVKIIRSKKEQLDQKNGSEEIIYWAASIPHQI